jgi:hypothetical protein
MIFIRPITDLKVKHVYYTPLSDHLHGHFIISTLYHSCVLSFSAVPWSFYFFHDNEQSVSAPYLYELESSTAPVGCCLHLGDEIVLIWTYLWIYNSY